MEANFSFETSHLYFTVSDTAVGVPERVRDKLFTLFGKLNATSKVIRTWVKYLQIDCLSLWRKDQLR